VALPCCPTKELIEGGGSRGRKEKATASGIWGDDTQWPCNSSWLRQAASKKGEQKHEMRASSGGEKGVSTVSRKEGKKTTSPATAPNRGSEKESLQPLTMIRVESEGKPISATGFRGKIGRLHALEGEANRRRRRSHLNMWEIERTGLLATEKVNKGAKRLKGLSEKGGGGYWR